MAPQQAAGFLNQYFRPADASVSASELNIQLPADVSQLGAVIDPELSQMGTDGTVNDATQSDTTSSTTAAAFAKNTTFDGSVGVCVRVPRPGTTLMRSRGLRSGARSG